MSGTDMFQNSGYKNTRNRKRTLIIDFNDSDNTHLGSGTEFSIDLYEPFIIDKHSEIYLDNLVNYKTKNKKIKSKMNISDFQKSERDFAFVIDKNFKSQELIDIISGVDSKLIRNIRIFDVYEGANIPTNKKSVALNVTIQSSIKTLNDDDLNEITKKIISTVENKTGAKIRS